jgi:arabinose-5-phosphate isomerase
VKKKQIANLFVAIPILQSPSFVSALAELLRESKSPRSVQGSRVFMGKDAPKRRSAPKKFGSLSAEEQLRAAREIVRREAAGVWKLSYRLDSSFCEAVKHLYTCRGGAIVTGMGKAGLIGQKIAATLSSTGTRAHFLHPAEAFHGDLGRIHPDDVVVMLTQSGETAEVVQLLPSLRDFRVPLIAITAARTSTVGRAANVVIELGDLEEVCSLGLAPSTSTTAMLAVGDALALVLSKMRNFQADDFARFHPGGALGKKLSRVDDIMRPLAECRCASESLSVREIIVACSKPGRRSGAIMLTDDAGRLTGLFTDSDLARLFEKRDETALDRPMCTVMMSQPTTVPSGTRVGDAVSLLAQRKFSELPVVDKNGRPIGLVDVTDVVGLKADAEVEAEAKNQSPKKAA